MKVKIIMDSGIVYEIEEDINNFLDRLRNDLGVMKNTFIILSSDKDKVMINPSHISSIEIIQG